MRIPTIEVKRPDGKLVRVNESQRFLYAKMGCDMDPHNLRKKTSGSEQVSEDTTQEDTTQEDTPTDESAPTTLKRKMIIQPKPIKPRMIPMPRTSVQENLNDLLVD